MYTFTIDFNKKKTHDSLIFVNNITVLIFYITMLIPGDNSQKPILKGWLSDNVKSKISK